MKPVNLKRCDAEFQVGYCDAVPAQEAPGGLLLTWWILSQEEFDAAWATHRLVFECHQPSGWPIKTVVGTDLDQYPPAASWRLLPWEISSEAREILNATPAIRLDFRAGVGIPVGGGVIPDEDPGLAQTGLGLEINQARATLDDPEYNYSEVGFFHSSSFAAELTRAAK